jgi:hypothetical protein
MTVAQVAFLLLLPVGLVGQGVGERLVDLTRCYADSLNIAEWKIGISFDTSLATNGWSGATQLVPSYHRAVIIYDTLAIARVRESEWGEVVVHELVHLIVGDVGVLPSAFYAFVPSVALGFVRWYVAHNQERLVERLTRLLVRYLPPPRFCR